MKIIVLKTSGTKVFAGESGPGFFWFVFNFIPGCLGFYFEASRGSL